MSATLRRDGSSSAPAGSACGTRHRRSAVALSRARMGRDCRARRKRQTAHHRGLPRHRPLLAAWRYAVSVLFGIWNFDGHAVDPEQIATVRRMLDPHAPDGFTIFVKGAVAMLYGAVHITKESHRERQPFVSPAGSFLLWDGRLDNRTDLRKNLSASDRGDTDLQIVASVWERAGMHCLEELLGDWALAAFHHYERTLFLAKDFLGTRPLYYFRCHRYVAWSSLLEPLIALAEKLTVCERYFAGWLAGFPEAHLTPYQEIQSVPPASFVRITQQAAIV